MSRIQEPRIPTWYWIYNNLTPLADCYFPGMICINTLHCSITKRLKFLEGKVCMYIPHGNYLFNWTGIMRFASRTILNCLPMHPYLIVTSLAWYQEFNFWRKMYGRFASWQLSWFWLHSVQKHIFKQWAGNMGSKQ